MSWNEISMNNGMFGILTSECFVVLITEWEMVCPWSLIYTLAPDLSLT